MPSSANTAVSRQTLPATFGLQDPAFGCASAGVATLAGTPITTTGAAAGTAAWFRCATSTPGTCFDGSVTATGDGDLQLNTTTISVGVNVQITSGTFTMPSGSSGHRVPERHDGRGRVRIDRRDPRAVRGGQRRHAAARDCAGGVGSLPSGYGVDAGRHGQRRRHPGQCDPGLVRLAAARATRHSRAAHRRRAGHRGARARRLVARGGRGMGRTDVVGSSGRNRQRSTERRMGRRRRGSVHTLITRYDLIRRKAGPAAPTTWRKYGRTDQLRGCRPRLLGLPRLHTTAMQKRR
ncbi:hypothetical protein ADK47_05595 [Streptomyces rimosus subsp. rimosus]|nr:hypothetical protein ADK78_29780 [Kitasatospora aureofaciens]KOT44349.1 hypothetical protein ADK42_05580 [Streptomyces rimosus subsp. rimosus]KOT45163.1 hypothetical protein ADK84_05340 [Streptomyces sp. NRRL WC-3701]KOT59620.1 hypothetical protein ADK45_21770 [Streptomyces rimosus subsp. rimosus]KOT65752.1 hypothetical protein ADK44_06890 [Streptomyces rimosus subsp. rimosus]